MSKGLIDRFIHAALWSAGTSYVFFGINLLGQILLARLLFIQDFGLYASTSALRDIMLIFLGFATTQSFLYTDASQDQFNANVIINLFGCSILVLMGCIGLFIFGYSGHWSAGLFFLVLTIAQALTMMSYVYLAPLEKELKYRTVSLQQGLGGMLGMFLAIFLAYLTRSAWSLIIRDLTSGVLVLIFAYRIAPKKLSGKINWPIVKSQFSYGMQTGIARGMEIICYRFPDLVIQFFFGKVALGSFFQARYLCYLPMKILAPFTQQVLFAFFTHVRDDKEKMGKNLFWINYSVMIIAFPIMLAVYLWGGYFMVWLYGAKWQAAGIYFEYFSLFILFGVLFNMMQSAFYSLALQKHVSIAYILGIIVFVTGMVLINHAEYSALVFSLGFVVAYFYLLVVLLRHEFQVSVGLLYTIPSCIFLLLILSKNTLPAYLLIFIYLILMLLYFFLERQRLTFLFKRIVGKKV